MILIGERPEIQERELSMSTLVERADEVAIDDDDRLYEIIQGRRAEKPVGANEVILANRAAFAINSHAVPRQAGLAIVEVLVDIGHPGRDQFRPDLIYVSAERWPFGREIPPGNAWAVVPDLAVEVVSPSNKSDEIQLKIEGYLAAGVRQVWVIHPRTPCLYVHDGSDVVRLVSLNGSLDGGEIIPGFRLPLAVLFPGRPGPPVQPA